MKKLPLRLLALAVFLLVFPFFLRRRQRVVRRALINAKQGEVFPMINDLRNWLRWTEWSRREDMHTSYDGPPSGVGAIQRWETAKMDGMLKIVQSVPDERIAYQLDMSRGRYLLDGIIALEPAGEQTRVTWICKWDGDPNPYARYLDLLFVWWIGRDFDVGLANLRELLEKRGAHESQPAKA